ncbi:M43 family zinc metalloprotease [Aquimarina hainanensis]|uniref:M43 family zinc metalloprotease n=1 Tax=Aquimarina hainanensis TaxID=1578017 RepID=UPI00360C74C9
MWVCNLSRDTLGYAQFPGMGPDATNGVVVRPTFFGTTEIVRAPFNKGRTTTHEVAHWLNLQHIWGDGGCPYDDRVADTPVSNDRNHGCARYPTVQCRYDNEPYGLYK